MTDHHAAAGLGVFSELATAFSIGSIRHVPGSVWDEIKMYAGGVWVGFGLSSTHMLCFTADFLPYSVSNSINLQVIHKIANTHIIYLQ